MKSIGYKCRIWGLANICIAVRANLRRSKRSCRSGCWDTWASLTSLIRYLYTGLCTAAGVLIGVVYKLWITLGSGSNLGALGMSGVSGSVGYLITNWHNNRAGYNLLQKRSGWPWIGVTCTVWRHVAWIVWFPNPLSLLTTCSIQIHSDISMLIHSDVLI